MIRRSSRENNPRDVLLHPLWDTTKNEFIERKQKLNGAIENEKRRSFCRMERRLERKEEFHTNQAELLRHSRDRNNLEIRLERRRANGHITIRVITVNARI